MKVNFFLLFLVIAIRVYPQRLVIDTLENAVARINTYSSLPIYGTASSGAAYGAGLNLFYDQDGKPLPAEFVRIDFSKKTVTYKTMPEVISANGAFWLATPDDTGNFFASIHVPLSKVLLFNLEDSISYQDLGNPFQDGKSWAYSMSLGRDGKMYFGGNPKTYWSIYDPATRSFEKHPMVDPGNDYLLSIAGDIDYVYAQTGQRNFVQLWSVRKKDEHKKLLATITNSSRIQLDTREDGIYATFNTDTLRGAYKLENGEIGNLVKSIPLRKDARKKLNKGAAAEIKAAFDAGKNKVYFSPGSESSDSVEIRTNSNAAAIKMVFAFPGDKRTIYFTSDYYGNFYKYDLITKTNSLLGATGYNIYSTLALNDSIMFLGGYPSGCLLMWNRNQPWTTKKLVNGKVVEATDENANPRIQGFWKSQGNPPAGFHHVYKLLFDAKKNIAGAGNVIRIGNAASIGIYNKERKSLFGINYEPFTGLGFRDIANWKNLIIYSMISQSGLKPKLFFYSSETNSMVDSVDLGFDDYGKIYIQRNVLYGAANDRVYKFDLKKKKILAESSYPKHSILNPYFLSNGRVLANTKVEISPGILKTFNLNYEGYCEANGIVYAIKNKKIVRIRGILNK